MKSYEFRFTSVFLHFLGSQTENYEIEKETEENISEYLKKKNSTIKSASAFKFSSFFSDVWCRNYFPDELSFLENKQHKFSLIEMSQQCEIIKPGSVKCSSHDLSKQQRQFVELQILKKKKNRTRMAKYRSEDIPEE